MPQQPLDRGAGQIGVHDPDRVPTQIRRRGVGPGGVEGVVDGHVGEAEDQGAVAIEDGDVGPGLRLRPAHIRDADTQRRQRRQQRLSFVITADGGKERNRMAEPRQGLGDVARHAAGRPGNGYGIGRA